MIAPSMMCCDFLNPSENIREFEKEKIDLLHIDVMDGSFVPNFALGTDFIKQLKRATDIPLDIHLMIDKPENHIDSFPIGENDIVSIHYESTTHLQRILSKIKEKGASPFLALNPSTPVEMVMDVLDDIDGLLIMSVNPGFAGQKMIPHSIEKIKRARSVLDNLGKKEIQIEVDGNVSIENAIKMKNAGANIFVLGTAALFWGSSLTENIRAFRCNVF